jgi:hypothetical protein
MGRDPPDRSGLRMMGQHPTAGNRNLGPALRSALRREPDRGRVEVYREAPLRYIRKPPELIDLRIEPAKAIPITAIIMSR